MADLNRRMVVELLGQDRSFSKTLKGAGEQTNRLNAHMGRLSSSLGKVAGAFAGIALVGAGVNYMKEAAQAAAEDEKAQAKLAQVLKNTTKATDAQVKATEDWITKQQFATGISDTDYRKALQNLTAATRDVGKAQKLTTVAQDIAISKGLDLDTVTKAMAKAYNGNAGALGKLGIATKDASGKALTFEQIMAKAKDTFGGSAAAAANTTAGKFQILGERMGELKESVGAALMPAMTKLADFLLANMPTIESVATAAINALATGFTWLSVNVFPVVTAAFKALHDFWVTVAWPNIQKAAKAFHDWFFGGGDAGPAGRLKGFWGVLKSAFKSLADWWSGSAWPALKSAAKAFHDWFFGGGENSPAGKLKAIWGHVKDAFVTMKDILVRNWPNIKKTIVDAWAIAGPALGAMVTVFEKIAGAISWAITQWDKWDQRINGAKQYTGTNAHEGVGIATGRGGHTTKTGAPGGASNKEIMEALMPGFSKKFSFLFDLFKPGGTGYGGMASKTEGVWNAVRAAFPGASFMGGYATSGHVKNSDHYSGHAFDVGGSTGLMRAIADMLGRSFGSMPLKYIIYDRKIDFGGGWKPYHGSNPHTDHVHVSTYDQGGWLQPGATVTLNKTRKPEAILTAEQWQQLLDSRQSSVTVNIQQVVANDPRQFVDQLRRELRGYNLRLA